MTAVGVLDPCSHELAERGPDRAVQPHPGPELWTSGDFDPVGISSLCGREAPEPPIAILARVGIRPRVDLDGERAGSLALTRFGRLTTLPTDNAPPEHIDSSPPMLASEELRQAGGVSSHASARNLNI